MSEDEQKTAPETGAKDVEKRAKHGKHAKTAPSDEGPAADGDGGKADEPENAPCDKKRKRSIAILVAVLVALLAVVVWGCASMYMQYLDQKAEEEKRAAIQMPEPPRDVDYIPDNPIDFPTLTAEYPDLYAWMAYPATGINLPIFQEPVQSAEDLYLRHDMDGEYSLYGELYTQKYNTKTFQDPVTVIYGHTFPDTEIMFTPLHLLEDEAFFIENPELQIYIPKKALTYEVISVAETDNTLILAANEFGNVDVLQAYYDSILDPESDFAYVREGATLNAETDKIIQLSTCTIPSDPAHRFIVTAKLVTEQETT